jgi:hypothetical protein
MVSHAQYFLQRRYVTGSGPLEEEEEKKNEEEEKEKEEKEEEKNNGHSIHEEKVSALAAIYHKI